MLIISPTIETIAIMAEPDKNKLSDSPWSSRFIGSNCFAIKAYHLRIYSPAENKTGDSGRSADNTRRGSSENLAILEDAGIQHF